MYKSLNSSSHIPMRMDDKTQKALEQFGLSQKETKVYFACLELGSAPAYDISLKADIPRTLTYDILQRLMELSLVSCAIERRKKHFKAAPPHKFVEILNEKKQAINGVMKALTEVYNHTPEKKRPHSHQFDGKEGIKTIYEDILRSDIKEYVAIGCSGNAPKLLPYYLPGFYRRKSEKKINLKLVFRDTKEARKRAEQLKQVGYVEVRYMPEKYATPISIYCYGNKTAMIMWSKLEPLAFRIDCKDITDGFRSYIMAMWGSAKKK